MKTALILAAGSGKRFNHDRPKGFIEINNKTLIATSIDKLTNNGYTNIVIVTGYKREYYEKLKNVTCIYNPNFKETGSAESLLIGLQYIQDLCVILESDIIYDEKMLDIIQPDSILMSTLTYNTDEVYVELENEQVIGLSKDKKTKNEFIGITALSKETIDVMNSQPFDKNSEYEDILITLGLNGIETKYKWCEIDTTEQLKNAILNYSDI